MIKKILFIISVMLFIPVFGEELETALMQDKPVLLYIYTRNCNYCQLFNPYYNNYKAKYGTRYNFVKIDADTHYGYKVMRKFKARYVPYVAVINKKGKVSQVHPSCLQVYVCMDEVFSRK